MDNGKIGLRARTTRTKKRASCLAPRLAFESLEPRRLLSVAAPASLELPPRTLLADWGSSDAQSYGPQSEFAVPAGLVASPASAATPLNAGTSITAVSTTTTAGTYGAGTVIPITVTFDRPVTVTGTPQLVLNSGTTVDAVANYTGGSGTSTLKFTYALEEGEYTLDLDYASTAALTLNGGMIKDASGNAASLTLPALGSDGLATRNIVISYISDGFESGDFTALPWILSNVAAKNWTVENAVVHDGTYAAESGAVSGASKSVLSLTETLPDAGEICFWRTTSSATGTGSLIFEIDNVPMLKCSGTVAWQESYSWVAAGQHTFTWLYGKNAGDPAGNDYAVLDDVQYIPGATLVVNGTTGNDVFSFDARGAGVVTSLNGEVRDFAAGEFTSYVFHGAGSHEEVFLAGSTSGANSATLDADGSGQLDNSTAGFAVTVDGMSTIHVEGRTGDVAKFYDSPGNDTFYAYADYKNSGQQLAGMYGSYGGGYSNSASGFGTNIGYSTNGGSDHAVFFDSPGNDTFYAYADYKNSGQSLAGMYGSYGGGYSNSAKGFASDAGIASDGGTDVAGFFDAPGANTYYAYGDYNNSGKQLAGMYGNYGGGYSNSASGFGTNIGSAGNGSSDTASLVAAPGNNALYTDLTIARLYGNGYSEEALGFQIVNAIGAPGGTNTEGQGQVHYELNYLGPWGGSS